MKIEHELDRNIYAKVIADSVTLGGGRVTTIEVNFHRFILAEFNTHRRFSRNSASSRAIPVYKQIEAVRDNPAVPIAFFEEQPGMSGRAELTGIARERAEGAWRYAAEQAATQADTLRTLSVHKSITNRLLEPFLYHRVIVTSTEWENFFKQRLHKDAQPEMIALAEVMHEAYRASAPDLLGPDEWHTPYVTPEDREALIPEARVLVSAARSARVSYLTHEGVRSVSKDLDLYKKLVGSEPIHYSPTEHQVRFDPTWTATPWGNHGLGWVSHRMELEASA